MIGCSVRSLQVVISGANGVGLHYWSYCRSSISATAYSFSATKAQSRVPATSSRKLHVTYGDSSNLKGDLTAVLSGARADG